MPLINLNSHESKFYLGLSIHLHAYFGIAYAQMPLINVISYVSKFYGLSVHIHEYFSIAYTQMPLINVNAHVSKFYLRSEYSSTCIL